MKAYVGMKVQAYTGRCIGVKIESTTWAGEIVKVNAKSIRVRLTESVSRFGNKEQRRWSMNVEKTYRFVKVLSDGRSYYRSEADLYGGISL